LKCNSEKEKADLEKKLEATNSLLEQREKDFQNQKTEVQCPVILYCLGIWWRWHFFMWDCRFWSNNEISGVSKQLNSPLACFIFTFRYEWHFFDTEWVVRGTHTLNHSHTTETPHITPIEYSVSYSWHRLILPIDFIEMLHCTRMWGYQEGEKIHDLCCLVSLQNLSSSLQEMSC
jgi:hypothetical protein